MGGLARIALRLFYSLQRLSRNLYQCIALTRPSLPDCENENWAKQSDPSVFAEFPDASTDQLVVHGYWTTYAGQRQQTVSVASSLVSSDTADALVRALDNTNDPHEYALPEFESHNEIDHPKFTLSGWIAETGRYDGLDDLDPWAAGIPCREFVVAEPYRRRLELKGLQDGQRWNSKSSDGEVISEVWSDGASDEDDRFNRGHRLLVNRALIQDLLDGSDRKLILEVRVRRELSFGQYEYSKDDFKDDKASIKKTGDPVVDLGNQIIRELGDDRYSDLLTRWMASYIADLIAKAEQADEAQIEPLRQECANAILLLWRHRSSWPDRTRPFKELEPLISTLEGLDPDKNIKFYQQQFWQRAENQATPEELKKWLQIAQGIDHTARILIEQALDAAQRIAISQNVDWVKAALQADVAKGSDVELTMEFISRLGEPELGTERHRSKLEGRLARVDSFLAIADMLRKDIETQLSSLDE